MGTFNKSTNEWVAQFDVDEEKISIQFTDEGISVLQIVYYNYSLILNCQYNIFKKFENSFNVIIGMT